jgi:predicted HAD superfamily phosphohydrolase YqeG
MKLRERSFPKKRGRPAGSLNKRTQAVVDSFSETLSEWDRMENEVDFKDLCQKLQEALARSYVEAEELEKQITYWRNETGARDIVIRYLEGRK